MGIYIKDTVQKITGYILAAPGLLLFIIGIAILFDPKEELSTGIAVVLLSFFFIIPSVFFIWKGVKSSEEEEFIESTSAIVTTTRRITLVDLAEKLDTSVPKARKTLLKAISLKLIYGNFDRTTGEFFTEEGKNTNVVYKFCPTCGAPFNKTFLEGETIKCDSCNTIIQ